MTAGFMNASDVSCINDERRRVGARLVDIAQLLGARFLSFGRLSRGSR